MERHISWSHPGFRLLANRKIQKGIAVVTAIGLITSRVVHASDNPSVIGIMATIAGLLFCAYVVFDLRGPRSERERIQRAIALLLLIGYLIYRNFSLIVGV